ncbi:MAG: DUF5123 domain-containing protein, partial [Melioribacteraceae bacterium]|nr:DUF5123 domain-containing protein [Melioribacteraceae bacterium]
MNKIMMWLLLLTSISSNAIANTFQDKYRWRNDDGSETTATWKKGENTAIHYGGYDNVRLRFQFYMHESSAIDNHLQLSYATDISGPWTPITTDGSSNAFILSSSIYFADLDPTTRQLSENVEHPFVPGKLIESSANFAFTLDSESTEYEICIKATENIGDLTYYFKLYNTVHGDFKSYEYAVWHFSNIIYVDADATGNNDGSNWTNAYTSLQSALDEAESGLNIWVAAGIYKPSKEPDGTTDEPRKFTFQMKNGVEIYGGFAGTETSLSQRDYLTNETILSGDLSGNDEFEIGVFNVYKNNSGTDNCYSVLLNLGNSLTSTAILDGFTISGGNANASFPGNAGAGVVTDGTPVLRNLIFTHNYSVSGGALFLVNAGGGNLSNLSFIENSGGEGSGGLYLYELSSPAVLTNALFLNNRGVKGGGIDNTNSTLTVNNATFSRNEVWGNGGAIENRDNGTLTLNNCIIWNNIAYDNGNEIYHSGNTTTLNNCCYKNEAGDVYGTLTLGSGNITSDPFFVNASGGDLTLFGNSSCVNTGNNSYNSESYDIRLKTRTQNTTIDMGAYEWTSGTDPENRIIYVNVDASGNNDGSSWTNAYTSLQSALDAATAGDQIWIAGGTYKPTSAYNLTNTLRYYHFELINNVVIYGGFAGTETSVGQRTDYGYGGTNETILSGDIGTIGDNSDNCYHVLYNPPYSITNSAILDGVTVSGGNANLWSNTELKRGGGMYMPQNSPIIRNVTFTGNNGIFGGAVFNMVSSGIYSNCLFFNNSAEYGGASMTYSSTALNFDNCTFYGNTAVSHGGGVDNWNSAFSYNNCIFWGNTSAAGNQIYAYGTSTITLNTSCYSGNANDIAVESGASIITTNNNITSNPLFVDAVNHDYRLYGNSPAVNTGNNSYNSSSTDIRGKDRIQNTTIDMGAYEWTSGVDPEAPLPVELTSFTAASANSSTGNSIVILNWQTATEVNNYGFEVERSLSISKGNWEMICFIPGNGNCNSTKNYSYTDTSVPVNANPVLYRLKQIDTDGRFDYSDI